jgi:hypothetical protein
MTHGKMACISLLSSTHLKSCMAMHEGTYETTDVPQKYCLGSWHCDQQAYEELLYDPARKKSAGFALLRSSKHIKIVWQ